MFRGEEDLALALWERSVNAMPIHWDLPSDKDREGETSFQPHPMKAGLFMLHVTRVRLEWLKVATLWRYSEHLGELAIWIALRMPSWSLT